MATLTLPEPATGSRVYGYARVSTGSQTLRQQTNALLEKAGCVKIFHDVQSGTTTKRSGLDGALEALKPGDTLVVVALDRLGRSLFHFVKTA
jgi:DNA invertase Pin-like site-specific DNA recombinase